MIYKQIAVRLPRLLDKDLKEVRRLRPDAQSINLNIAPPSTASLTLPDKSSVPVRAFIELYNAKGSVGIYRVNMPEEGYGSGDRVSLSHGICVLEDAIIRGQGKITGTPREVLEKILEHQTARAQGKRMWKLGVVEAPESKTITVEHDGTKTLEMLARAMNELEGYMLSFSQAEFPWTVHVLKKKSVASCEGRLSRNIRTIRKNIDDSELVTKLYCSLLEDGYVQSDTADAWGVVEKEITLNDGMSKSDALKYCKKYLKNRENPTVSIEMDADEWFAMTGEPIDRFEIGDICRLALPEYGVTIEERIVALNYMDALGRPEAVTVSIANQVQDMSIKTEEMRHDIDSLQHTAAGYGNRIASSEQNITNLKTEDEGFKEIDGKMLKWFSSAEIDLDATEEGASVGILATYQQTYDLFSDVDVRVTEAELILKGSEDGAEAGLIARVDENEASISATATSLGSKIELKADITYVDNLVAESIDAAFADLKITDAETIVTDYLTVKDKATINAMALGGKSVTLKTTEYVKKVGRTKRYVKSPADVTIEIWEISSISNDELKYLGYD